MNLQISTEYPLSAYTVLLLVPHTPYFKTQIMPLHTSRGGDWWGKRDGRHQLKIPILNNVCHTMVVTKSSEQYGCPLKLTMKTRKFERGGWWGKQHVCQTLLTI